MSTTEIVWKHFHDTIMEDISKAGGEDLIRIASQLKRTIIPKDRIDSVIATWIKRCKELGLEDIDLGVPASLLRQKEIAEAKAAGYKG